MGRSARLGGMALANGVLVHGERCWACAVRTASGELRLASGRKPLRAADRRGPLRGPARLAEALLLLPVVKRALPEADLPLRGSRALLALAAGAVATRVIRDSRLGGAAQEGLVTALALAPPALALHGSELTAYHGAEHIAIGSWEHGEPRPREHERCGSHLAVPILLTTTLGNLLARLAPPRARVLARGAASLAALAASSELFAWISHNRERPLARALARPGYELQHRLLTAEPSPAQLEVADAALSECLRLEESLDAA